MKGFASDNNSGVHPAIMEAMTEVNKDHEIAYGDDPSTEKAINNFKKLFGNDIEVFFVFTGTAANVLGLKSATESFHSIICADTAHINVDECGAPEKFTGCKVIPVPTENGKITIEGIKPHMHGFGFEHHSQPGIISITQATELGTVYKTNEIKELAEYAHKHGLYLHMDGARLANAAVALDLDFKEFTKDVGVDILSFGGTKNGMMYGEAIIFFKPELANVFKYYRKQGMQLASKMRYISAQFNAYLSNELWKKNANHSNKMARILADKVKEIPQVKITQHVDANGVFAIIPSAIIGELQKHYFFYVWNEETSEVRWMTSFDTTPEDIEGFVRVLKDLLT